MTAQRKWDRSDVAILRRFAELHTAKHIGLMLGRTESAVHSAARRYGVYLMKVGPLTHGWRHSDDTVRDVLRRYYVERKGIKRIAREMDMPFGTVLGYVKGRNRPHLRREFVGKG